MRAFDAPRVPEERRDRRLAVLIEGAGAGVEGFEGRAQLVDRLAPLAHTEIRPAGGERPPVDPLAHHPLPELGGPPGEDLGVGHLLGQDIGDTGLPAQSFRTTHRRDAQHVRTGEPHLVVPRLGHPLRYLAAQARLLEHPVGPDECG